MLRRYLMHQKLIVRFSALLAVVSIVFAVVWGASYLFFPEGLLTGRTGAQALAGEGLAGGSVWIEWIRILALNLAISALFMVTANLIITKRGYPLGYVVVVMNATIFAVTIGTNSFTIPMPVRLSPTLAIFGSSGPYEIVAYVLAVAATTSLGRWRIKRWWAIRGTTERVHPPTDRSTIRQRNAGALSAFAILAAACAWEAFRISAALDL